MDLNEQVFNYWMSHGKRNAFEILASRFLVLQSTMQQEPQLVKRVVTACVVLHNLLTIRSGRGQFQVDNKGLNLDNAREPDALSGRVKGSCRLLQK